jgi:hypothetical protein
VLARLQGLREACPPRAVSDCSASGYTFSSRKGRVRAGIIASAYCRMVTDEIYSSSAACWAAVRDSTRERITFPRQPQKPQPLSAENPDGAALNL